MKLFQFLQKTASYLQSRRGERYGEKTKDIDNELFKKESRDLTFKDAIYFLGTIFAFSPIKFLKNLFTQIADYDTRKRIEKIQSLRSRLEKQISHNCNIFTGFFVRSLYSRDLSEVPKIIEKLFFKTNPFIVVQPKTEKDVISIFNFANKEKIPIFPRGVGSSGFGGSIPTNNGIVIDLSPMNKIIDIDSDKLQVEVEPGARWAEIDKALKAKNLALFTFPTSRFSTVGGWIATGGLGLNSLKFGHLIEHVNKIKVVFPNGDLSEIHKDDPRFSYFFGTEGQIGIVLRIWLKIKIELQMITKNTGMTDTFHHLLFFDNPKETFKFAKESLKRGFDALNIKYLDKKYVQDLNYILSISKLQSDEKFLLEKDALFYNFEDKILSDQFLNFVKESNVDIGKRYMSNYIWGDRYSPMKIKKLGPSLLASELIMPLDSVTLYMSKLDELGKKFGVKFLFQINFVREGDEYKCLVISMFTCDQRKFFRYFIYLNLTQYATLAGIQEGGIPYGIGIWNSPFLKYRYSKERLHELKNFKRKVDNKFILNPMKVLSLRSRFFNIPALLLHPVVFRLNMKIIIAFGGFLVSHGFLRDRTSHEKKPDRFKEIILQCTSCGACGAICPAYITTKDERVIARSKLRLFQELLEGKRINDIEAENFFLCIRCGMCERVCQSRLPLRELWDEFERSLKEGYPVPREKIEDFISTLDEDRCFLDIITHPTPKR
ncbi:FAD-binding protein [bacterium]|nr:FAD-binding protein [bacterium]